MPLDTRIRNIQNGSYVKDLNNEMNKFTGTWRFNDGTSSFTLIIQKQENVFNGDYYRDYLVGEYAYTLNGIEVINTLSSLNTPLNQYNNIGGKNVVIGQDYGCEDCINNERRFRLYFIDPERKYLSTTLIIRYLVDESNPEKITATIISRGSAVIPVDGYTSPRVPYGTYLMEKQ